MSRSIIPLNIRPHLVPFLYQEFEGIESQYLNTRVKAAKVNTGSTVGKMIRLLAEKSDYPLKAEKYNVFLSIKDEEYNNFFGGVFKYASGTYSFLRLPEEACKLINDHFEEMFRLTLVCFVMGYSTKKQQGDVSEGINIFLDSFNLREYGYSESTLRKIYERELRAGAVLNRMQKAVGNRVLNYF